MDRIAKRLGFLIAALAIILIAVLIVYVAWEIIPWVVLEIVHLYNGAGTEFKLGLIAAVLSTSGLVWTVTFQRKKEIENQTFEKKKEAYSAFFDMFFDIMERTESGVDILDDDDIKKKFRNISKSMMIWGSYSTINAYNEFQVDSLVPSDDIKVTFDRVERLLLQFRRDLGHRDRKLKRFALTKLIVKGDDHHQLDD